MCVTDRNLVLEEKLGKARAWIGLAVDSFNSHPLKANIYHKTFNIKSISETAQCKLPLQKLWQLFDSCPPSHSYRSAGSVKLEHCMREDGWTLNIIIKPTIISGQKGDPDIITM